MATDTAYADARKLYEASRQRVEGSYDAAKNKLQESYDAQKPLWQKERDNISNQANMATKATNQQMADWGLNRSGSNVGTQAGIRNTANTAIADVGRAESQAAAQLANRLAELNQSQQTELAALEGREGQDLRQYGLQERGLNLQEAGLTGLLNGQQTLAAQQMAIQKALSEAGLTGQYNGQQTLAAQQLARQQALDDAEMLGVYKGQQTLTAKQLAQQQALAEAGLTGQYNGSETLAAQQLAEQIRQNQLQQQLAIANLTGEYNGQNTLEGKQQDWYRNTYVPWQQQQAETGNLMDLYKTLLNYNATQGANSPEWVMPGDWKYGDDMVKIARLLATQLYG